MMQESQHVPERHAISKTTWCGFDADVMLVNMSCAVQQPSVTRSRYLD